MDKIVSKHGAKRTDLAFELIKDAKTSTISNGIKRTDITLNKSLAEKFNKSEGAYITVETDAVKRGQKHRYDAVAKELSNALSELLFKNKDGKKVKIKNCLVAALGNPDMTADALGKHVADRLLITRHLNVDLGGDNLVKLSCVTPNVLGVTGIESFDIVAGVKQKIEPDIIIVIDSLAGAATERIASAFQVSDAGITPGSGVSNHRMRFDENSFGVRVVSIGVPLVVYASTIIDDALISSEGGGIKDTFKTIASKSDDDFFDEIAGLVVTPKDIDIYVKDCAQIVADAINLSFFGETFRV